MDNRTSALLVGAGIVAYTLLSKGHALGSINFLPGSIKELSLENGSPVLKVGIVAQNTSSQQFVIRSIAGNVNANGYLVGSVSFFQEVTIPANAQVEIPIELRFGLLGVVQDIINAWQTHSFTQDVVFSGYANVDNYQVPIKNTYKVGA